MLSKSVLLGMSGGVDSSVSLLLLKNQGYDVHGITIVMFENEEIGLDKDDRVCGSEKELADARALAKKLKCHHYTVVDKKAFRENVMEYFSKSYEAGETPNPCAVCNKTVKFPNLLFEAEKLGISKVATGHYARIVKDETSDKYKLFRAIDEKKDQSYFLYKLGQKELARLIFPLGDLTKTEVRKIAADAGFEVAEKKDSQDICFVKNRTYVEFLKDIMKCEMQKGRFFSLNGEDLGEHQGFISYTIGQRKGLGVTFGEPMYVVQKNCENFSIVLGKNEDLFSKAMLVSNLSYVSGEDPEDGLEVEVKARNTSKPAKAKIFKDLNGNAHIEFFEKQRALTLGQSAVFYIGDEVVGGGEISKIL